jgi:hypothetical protein
MFKIKKILPKIASTKNNLIYYWDSTGVQDNLCLINVTAQVKDLKEAVDIKNSAFDLEYLNKDNPLNFINFQGENRFVEPFPLKLTPSISISMMVMYPYDKTLIETNNPRVLIWGFNSYGLYGDRSTKNRKTLYELTVPFINTVLFAKG